MEHLTTNLGNVLRLFATNKKHLNFSGTLACNDNEVCNSAELDGKTIGINQDLQIIIDVTSARIKKVRGRTRGNVSISNVPAFGFRGTVKGQAICIGADPTPCKTLDMKMQVGARLFNPNTGDVVGLLGLDLTGVFKDGNWRSLGGSGLLESRKASNEA